MLMFKVDVRVGNPDGGDLAPVQPVVDTGAAHSMLPESLMTQLRILPTSISGSSLPTAAGYATDAVSPGSTLMATSGPAR